MNVLNEQEVRSLIGRVGPSLGCGDHTYGPVFPEGRTDVCAVRRMAENGSDYGYDTIYLLWKGADGSLKYRELVDSSRTKDYLYIDSITMDKNQVSVHVSSKGSHSGRPGSESFQLDISS